MIHALKHRADVVNKEHVNHRSYHMNMTLGRLHLTGASEVEGQAALRVH